MLRTTRQLLTRFAENSTIRHDEEDAFTQVIRRHGSVEDAEALVDSFLVDPRARHWLIEIVRSLGTAATAVRLYETCVMGDQLADNVPTDVLHAFGHLRYEPAQSLLWRYATAEASDHYAVRDACLGLLDLPCTGLEQAIAAAISAHEGANVFPELLPSLAVKTNNPLWIPRLVRWGREHASTDCNGGLLLGIAMFGAPARDAFLAVLADPRWEADASATGSRYWAFLGARVLGVGIAELYAAARAEGDRERQRHRVHVLAALLELWSGATDLRCVTAPTETASELLALLFTWSTPHRDDGLRGLAREIFEDYQDPIHDRLYQVERDLRARAVHDLEVQELRQPDAGVR